jgi:hypothetical protein
VKQIQHNESREHIREHLQAAYFLSQTNESPLLRYLLEMAIVENEGKVTLEPNIASSAPRSRSMKASRVLSMLLKSDLDLVEPQTRKTS